ncbi:MAG: prepilin-type N-terminal cleavage/methylation domain-containing protein [Verrucomicrobia bacterium]|nr:prepilin-type N-terminal cleavage/methylation domain-containing protein [Verrucomicrobiota bacterium]
MAHRRTSAPLRSFTLVELLVVIAILGLVAGLAIPAIGKARETAQRGACASNLKTLAAAVLTTAAENNGCFPGLTNNGPDNGSLTWFSYALGITKDTDINKAGKTPACLVCPASKQPPRPGITPVQSVSYGINTRLITPVNDDPGIRRRMAAVPKPSQIILLGDGASYDEDGNNAYQLNNVQGAAGGMGTNSMRHKTGANIAWCDGHVSYEGTDSLKNLWAQENNTNWVP